MNNRRLRDYIANNHFTDEFETLLHRINTAILNRYRILPNSLQNAIAFFEEKVLLNQNHLLDAQEIRWLENYFDICTQFSINYEQVREHKNCYNREFEL